MTVSKLSPVEKIAALRQTFIAQLPQRLDAGLVLLDKLLQHPNDPQHAEELQRFFHTLKGTSRTFNFTGLDTALTRGEHYTKILIETPTQKSDQWQQQLHAVFEALHHGIMQSQTQQLEQAFLTQSNLTQQPHDVTPIANNLIYLCDDEALLIEYLATQLNCFGYDCHLFHSTQAIYEAIQHKRPDVIIMDLGFPENEKAGTAFLNKIKNEFTPRIPSILLSARNDFEARLCAVRVGTAAYFRKPAKAIDIVAILDTLTKQKEQEPFRILIVDDELELAHYHAALLEQAGMHTQVITEPDTILEHIQNFRPDMILMDMYMPKCSGKEVAEIIRQIPEFVALPIVYLSSEQDQEKQLSAMQAGVEDFVTKPVIPQELVKTVTLRADRMRILRSYMIKDSMTGLYNHTTTSELLNTAWLNAQRENTPLTFVMIDIDFFKRVNDTNGHPIGDQVIIGLARLLQQHLRISDLIGRYGGEEFAVILPNTNSETAYRLIEQLRQDFARILFNGTKDGFSCTISAGIASYPEQENTEILLQEADQALYRAKRSGRNQVVCADKKLQ